MCTALIKPGDGNGIFDCGFFIFFFFLTVQKSCLDWDFFSLSSPGVQKISLNKNFLLQCGTTAGNNSIATPDP